MPVSRGRRQARFPEPKPVAGDEAGAAPSSGALAPLAFSLAFPDAPGCTIDFTQAACPRLMRPLLTALRQEAQVGGRIGCRGTAYSYAGALSRLDAFLAGRVPRPAEMALRLTFWTPSRPTWPGTCRPRGRATGSS